MSKPDYQKILSDPATLPTTLKFLADYLDKRGVKVEVKPDTKKPPAEYWPSGEIKRFLSDGTLLPERNAVRNTPKPCQDSDKPEIGSTDDFKEKYRL